MEHLILLRQVDGNKVRLFGVDAPESKQSCPGRRRQPVSVRCGDDHRLMLWTSDLP